jgi:hypothetical protein
MQPEGILSLMVVNRCDLLRWVPARLVLHLGLRRCHQVLRVLIDQHKLRDICGLLAGHRGQLPVVERRDRGVVHDSSSLGLSSAHLAQVQEGHLLGGVPPSEVSVLKRLLQVILGLDAIQEFVILRLVFSDGPKVHRVLGLELREHGDSWLVRTLVSAHVGTHGILGIWPKPFVADVLQGCLLWLLPTREVEAEII